MASQLGLVTCVTEVKTSLTSQTRQTEEDNRCKTVSISAVYLKAGYAKASQQDYKQSISCATQGGPAIREAV